MLSLACRALPRRSRPLSRAAASAAGGFSYPAPRALDAIVKTEMLHDYDAPKVAALWEEYHNMRSITSTSMAAR